MRSSSVFSTKILALSAAFNTLFSTLAATFTRLVELTSTCSDTLAL